MWLSCSGTSIKSEQLKRTLPYHFCNKLNLAMDDLFFDECLCWVSNLYIVCIDMTTWLLVLFFLAPMIVLNRCKWLFHMLLSPPCFPYNCFPHQVRSAWWGSVCSTMLWSPCTMLRRGGKGRSWSGRRPRLSSSSCWSCSVMVSSHLCVPFH